MPTMVVSRLTPSQVYSNDPLYFGSDMLTAGAYGYIMHNSVTNQMEFPIPSGGLSFNTTILAAQDHSSGITGISGVFDDYGTLVTGQTYRALYARYNVRSTTPSNPTAEVTGVEGCVGSYVNDEALTFRGGYFRTYINADATSSMRTAIGCEVSARASYSGDTECVAEAGTVFAGLRIWMAPYFSAVTVGNINNFWGLWIFGEHATQRNANAAIYISDAGGGWVDGIRVSGTFSGYALNITGTSYFSSTITILTGQIITASTNAGFTIKDLKEIQGCICSSLVISTRNDANNAYIARMSFTSNTTTPGLITVNNCNLYFDTSARAIQATSTDTSTLLFQARDSGVGLVTVARLVGAADAYFEATLGLVLGVITAPATPVEGMLIYNSATNKLNFHNGVGWEVVTSA